MSKRKQTRKLGVMARFRGWNQRGQAAVFIALIFQVLFVFFAMALNVALVVHDKINLQNSTDLAAYYAAMKQAELLNVMAHENYMIRQSWKLAAWRYRVMGTMGMIEANTAHPTHTGDISDSVWAPAVAPSTCVTYQPNWKEVPPDENLCRRPDVHIPPLPEVKVIAGFLGLNQGIHALSQQLIAQFNAECVKHGAFNWWFSMSLMQAFRTDQRNRMQVIEALAADLSQGQNGDFTDLDGNSVLQGATQTFLKNLTFANQTGASLTLTNGLQGIDPSQWLPKVIISPTILYTDIDNSNGCNAVNRTIDDPPHEGAGIALLHQPWPSGLGASDLFNWIQMMDSVDPSSDWQFTMGVEKNPWYEAYMGANTVSTPREIFYPISGATQMHARAFAKPFGGRIGPWYGNQWNSGDPNSSGTALDGLLPPRVTGNGGVDSKDLRRLPNYSRYPGDPIGLQAALSQNELTGLGSFKASFSYYINIAADYSPGGANDIMAWDGASGPQIRFFEMAALAPDLFDITYYSVEGEFYRNYFNRLVANQAALGIPGTTVIRPDLGFNGNAIPSFSVQDQISTVTNMGLQRQEAYYFVRDRFNLLTAWLPGPLAYNYDFSQAQVNFGHCKMNDDTFNYPNPGACVAGGGRTGYSTKMVSRDLLLSGNQQLGGDNSGAGPLLNPPPSDDRTPAGQ